MSSSPSNNVFIPILPINAGGGTTDAPTGAAPEASFTEADLHSLDAADGARLTSSVSSHLEPVAFPPNYVEGFVRP